MTMTYDLLIGDRSYSSWSLRGWLLFAAHDVPVTVHLADMRDPGFADALRPWAPARTVPAVRTGDGAVWSDSLTIAEGLAEAHPDSGHWPDDRRARGLARSMAAEMHSGFSALRSACPMNLRVAWRGFAPSDAVRSDLDRLDVLWGRARDMAGDDGPWLLGRYGAVDAFFAPVAMRIAGYGLPATDAMRGYVDAHLRHLPLRQWRAVGEARDRTLARYGQGLPTAAFPIPDRIEARAVSARPSVNDACPYSGAAPTHFMEAGGRVWGFCNAGCRDKTVADPAAWPAFMAIYESEAHPP